MKMKGVEGDEIEKVNLNAEERTQNECKLIKNSCLPSASE
jgi:hypothetical protein